MKSQRGAVCELNFTCVFYGKGNSTGGKSMLPSLLQKNRVRLTKEFREQCRQIGFGIVWDFSPFPFDETFNFKYGNG